MKQLLLLLIFPFLMGTTNPVEGDVDHRFFGVWKSLNGEFIQISRQDDFQVTFYRIDGLTRAMQSQGYIHETLEGEMEIKRQLPKMDTYTLEYVFSPSGNTMVVGKPYEKDKAWVFERVQ